MTEYVIREMTPQDFSKAILLWKETPGLRMTEEDTEQNLLKFLDRNKGLSFVCESEKGLTGTILCGHDGRRGFIYHLAVRTEFRMRGIGKELVEKSIHALENAGIAKCHLFVLHDNFGGIKFWSEIGWKKRTDIFVCSRNT